MATLAVIAFLGCAAIVLWVLVGYPLILAALPPRPWPRTTAIPPVSIVIPTYREHDELPVKLRSLRELDYPAELIEVVVVVDGDPDLSRIAALADPGARVLALPERIGKTAALNRGLEAATGEVVVLTDAGDPLGRGSIAAAVAHLSGGEVRAVGGRAHRSTPYDRYESWLRRLESRSGSVAALSGAFVAARREDIPRFPEGIVNDDLWLLLAIVRSGGRVIFEPEAVAFEPPVSAAGESERRARMAAGRAMLIGAVRGLPPRFIWRLASHKFGRLALPFAIAVALIASISLALAGHGQPWTAFAALQVSLVALGALAAAGVAPGGRESPIARAARQLIGGNLAVARGVGRAIRGRQSALWRNVR